MPYTPAQRAFWARCIRENRLHPRDEARLRNDIRALLRDHAGPDGAYDIAALHEAGHDMAAIEPLAIDVACELAVARALRSQTARCEATQEVAA